MLTFRLKPDELKNNQIALMASGTSDASGDDVLDVAPPQKRNWRGSDGMLTVPPPWKGNRNWNQRNWYTETEN